MTGGVFLLVAAASVALGMWATGMRGRALRRLRPERVMNIPVLPSPWLVWRELVARIGAAVPGSTKDLPELRRRLICAGYRNANAVRYFQGFRALSVVGLGGAAFLIGAKLGADNLMLKGIAMSML